MFKNEKYYVLKPTVHIIEDYFQTFVQKRNNEQISNSKILIDKDGFRHFWKGMVLPGRGSLRKADVPQLETFDFSNKEKKINENIQNNKVINDKIEILNKENNTTTLLRNYSQTIKIKEKPIRKKIKKTIFEPAKPAHVRQGTTQIKTTFFCPHFGVITMTANVENFNE